MTVSKSSGGYKGISWVDATEASVYNLINTPACILYAPLKSSLKLSKGVGDPTWSRTTAAWRFNELGSLQQIPSGCADFGGARLVRNILHSVFADSENLQAAGWVKQNCTASSADTLVCSAANTTQRIYMGPFPATFRQNFYVSFRATYVDHPFFQVNLTVPGTTIFINFDLLNGTYRSFGGDAIAGLTLIAPNVYDCWCILPNTVVVPGSSYLIIRFVNSIDAYFGSNFNGDGIKSVKLTRIFCADVTGYPVSYIPEYISVGVLSAPWQGAGIDGCQYFETDQYGNQLPEQSLLGFKREEAATNNILWSRNLAGATYAQTSAATPKAWIPNTIGAELVSNGTFDTDTTGWTHSGAGSSSVVSGKLRIDSTAGIGGETQDIPCVIGTTYYVSADVTMVSGSGGVSCRLHTDGTLTTILKEQASTSNITFGIIFTATSTAHRLYLRNAATQIADWDNVSVKVCGCVPISDATGLDQLPNTATSLTASTPNATILHPITLASAARCSSAYVRRKIGEGAIYFTQDGGSTWTNITSQLNFLTYTRIRITSTLANPSVGFKIETLGDSIEVDCVQNEAGGIATSPIVTTTSVITRNADSLTYQQSGNIDNTIGTTFASVMSEVSTVNRSAFDVANTAYSASNAAGNTQWQTWDGSTVVVKTGLTDISTGKRKRANSWGPAGLAVTGDGLTQTLGAFDGAFGSGTTITIANGFNGYIGPIAIFNQQLTEAEMRGITA